MVGNFALSKTMAESMLRLVGRNCALAYVAISLPILIALCFLTGPFQVSDEPSHFFRAIQLSHGHAQPVLGPAGRSAGGSIEISAGTLVDRFGNLAIDFNPAHRFVLGDVVSEWKAERADGPRTFTAFNNTAIYFPVAHALPAISIAAARQFGAPPLAWLYIGRITNALAAVAVSALAIALFEESGLFALVLCCLPMVLFEEASLSADALVIPFSVLLASLVARIARTSTFRWTFFAAMFISLLYVCVAKFAYLPLALLPPLVAVIQKKPARTILLLSAISAFAVGIWTYWSLLVHNDVFTVGVHTGTVDVHRQLQMVVHHPALFVGVLLQTIFRLHTLESLAAQVVGSRLGWLNVPMPALMIVLSLVTVVVSAVFRKSITPLRPGCRWATVLLLLASLVAVYLLLYLQFTPVGKATVDGMQGRYLLPLLAFLPLAAPGWLPRGGWGMRLSPSLVLSSEVTGLATAVVVWLAYWAQP